MLPAIISVTIVLFICIQIKPPYRYIAFPILFIPVSVFIGYIVAGLDLLFQNMPASQVFVDISFIGKSCIIEPMLLCTGQPCNMAFAITGLFCILSLIVSGFNFASYLISQKEVHASDS